MNNLTCRIRLFLKPVFLPRRWQARVAWAMVMMLVLLGIPTYSVAEVPFYSVPAIASQNPNPQTRIFFSSLDAKFQQLQSAAGTSAPLYLATDPSVNAFATIHDGQPIVVIYEGLLRAYGGDMDAIGAVLAHELGHVHFHHMERGAAIGAAFKLVTAVAGLAIDMHQRQDSKAAGLGMVGANIASAALTNAYTRDQEREADRYSVELLARATINPEAAYRSMEILHRLGEPAMIGIFRNHPLTGERLENIRTAINLEQPNYIAQVKREDASSSSGTRTPSVDATLAQATHERDARVFAEQRRVAQSEETALLGTSPAKRPAQTRSAVSPTAATEECQNRSSTRKTCIRTLPNGTTEIQICDKIGDGWSCRVN